MDTSKGRPCLRFYLWGWFFITFLYHKDFKNSDEMKPLKATKADKSSSVSGKKLLAEWTHQVDKDRIESIMSKPFPSQLDKDDALLPDDWEEQKCLFTYLY